MRLGPLSLHDHAVLALVCEQPRHGFAVAKELAAGGTVGHAWRVPRPQVYRSLARLEERDLVRPERGEPGDGGPERTVMAPTAAGRRESRHWLATPVDHVRDVRTELMLKLVLTLRLGREIQPLVEQQRRIFEPLHAGIADQAERAEGPDRLVALWRAESSTAVERFLRQAADLA